MARYGLIVYKWIPTTQPSKTSQLVIWDHHWNALRKETSITTWNEYHAKMQPTQGWKQGRMHEEMLVTEISLEGCSRYQLRVDSSSLIILAWIQ